MKNEGPFILEWVAHHRAIGFDQITVISNDLSDGSDVLLDALDHQGVIHHIHNVVPQKKSPQFYGYQQLHKIPNYFSDDDWVMVLDADEFLNIHICDGYVKNYLKKNEADFDIITLNWAGFGDQGLSVWEPGFVTEQFFWRANKKSQFCGQVKSFARGVYRFGSLGNHSVCRPPKDEPLKIRLPNGSCLNFCAVENHKYKRFVVQSVLPWVRSFDEAQINHYATKSYDSYIIRRQRGRGVNMHEDRHTDERFSQVGLAATEFDDSILQTHKIRRACFDELISISSIRNAHEQVLRNYKKEIEKVHLSIMADEEFFALN